MVSPMETELLYDNFLVVRVFFSSGQPTILRSAWHRVPSPNATKFPDPLKPFLAPSVRGASCCVNIDIDVFESVLPIVAQAVLPTPQSYRLAL